MRIMVMRRFTFALLRPFASLRADVLALAAIHIEELRG
jgi:hypothetical protein